MHELSETIQLPNGKWVNVSTAGGQKKLLEPKHPFEKPLYDTMDEAAAAAKKRSDLEPMDAPSSGALRNLLGGNQQSSKQLQQLETP